MSRLAQPGLTALSAFFAFGAVASGISCVTLLLPGTPLDLLWRVNPKGHVALLGLGAAAVALMGVVCAACGLAARGISIRAPWGRHLAVAILVVNMIGDTLNAFLMGDRRTLIGVPIAAAFIAFLMSPGVNTAFHAPQEICRALGKHLANEVLMSYPGFELAQVNIGRARGAPGTPVMAGFMAQLAAINSLAESSPGFVWRLQTEDGDATAVRPYSDESILINLSVWEDLVALQEFVFRTAHAEVMRHRREWFERYPEAYVVLWWVPAGHRPTVMEAVARLAHLQSQGAGAYAFTFREAFDPAGRLIGQGSPTDECPAT